MVYHRWISHDQFNNKRHKINPGDGHTAKLGKFHQYGFARWVATWDKQMVITRAPGVLRHDAWGIRRKISREQKNEIPHKARRPRTTNQKTKYTYKYQKISKFAGYLQSWYTHRWISLD